MSYQDIACLILKTNVLPMDGTTNAYGTSNSINTIFTWTNINLRTLLGDMFDKYDRFLLLLKINQMLLLPLLQEQQMMVKLS